MNREIKFRAWDEKRSTLFEVDANYFRKHVERRNDWFIGFNSTGLEVSEYEGKGNWRVFPIMQYTGLKDKNGTEIYEGDVLDLYGEFDEGFHPYHRSQVEFLDGAFCIEDHFEYVKPIPLSAWIEDSAGEHNIKVIGNIYENADLLSGESHDD